MAQEEEAKPVEIDAVQLAESEEVAETVQVDNPVICNLHVGDNFYSGEIVFVKFTMTAWRKWRKAIKWSRKGLKRAGYEADEQDMVIAYWSGAAIIESWDIVCSKDGEEAEPIIAPIMGKVPPEEWDFAFFTWFRSVANNYLVPRLGFIPA